MSDLNTALANAALAKLRENFQRNDGWVGDDAAQEFADSMLDAIPPDAVLVAITREDISNHTPGADASSTPRMNGSSPRHAPRWKPARPHRERPQHRPREAARRTRNPRP